MFTVYVSKYEDLKDFKERCNQKMQLELYAKSKSGAPVEAIV